MAWSSPCLPSDFLSPQVHVVLAHCSFSSSSNTRCKVSPPQNTFLPGTHVVGSFSSLMSLVPWFLLKVAISNHCRLGAPQALAMKGIPQRYLHFLQIEGLWQPCVEQVYWCHFSNSICSLCVSVSHLDNSRNISNLSSLLYLLRWCVICDLWCDYCKKIMTYGRFRWWLAFFSNKVFFNWGVYIVFKDVILLHT